MFENNPTLIVLIFIAVVLALAAGLRMLYRWDTLRRLRLALADLYLSKPVIEHLVNSYVDHGCYNTIPHPEFMQADEPIGEAVEVLTAYLLDQFAEKHCFVFGDPGVGKTAVLVRFMELNLQQRGFNRLDVYTVGMDVPGAYDRIAAVEDKHNKIIFIDAYQEEEVLDKDRKKRLIDLLEHCREFRKVVVFCRYDVVAIGGREHTKNRHRFIVKNSTRTIDYIFEIIRLQSIPAVVPEYFKDEYSGFGNRKEREAFSNYLSVIGPQIRYGFSLPFIPLFKDGDVSVQRPIEALEPAIRIQILSFLEEITPGKAEETREIIKEDIPGIWMLLGWVCEEAYKIFQVRRQVDDYISGDFLTRDELEEIEERLDMNAVQRAAIRHILFRTENRKYGRLRALRRNKNRNQEKKEERRKDRKPRNWGAIWRSNQDEQAFFLFSNRSVMEFLFARQIIDRVGALSNLPLTFHMQELLLELTGIRARLGERMGLMNGITAHELIDKYANPLDATESEDQNIKRFIISNIKQIDLSKYDLSGYMLSRAILRGANMEETLLDGARLDGADLQAANLKKASLSGSVLSHARLDGANLEETQALRVYLHEASITYAKMDYAFLSGSWLTGADFSHSIIASGDLESVKADAGGAKPLTFLQTDLRWVNLRYAELPGAVFTRAKLNNADLEQAQLQHATFERAELVEANLTMCDLQHVNFSHADLQGAFLKRAKLYGAEFFQAKLQGVNFEHAILHNISFVGADNNKQRLDMREVIFEHSNMRGAEIKFADLGGAELNFSNMRKIKIKHSSLAHTSIKKAFMEGAELSDVDLTGANLEKTSLNNATFKGDVTLDEAILTGASLQNANLEGRKISFKEAKIQQAYLYGANLSKAYLLNADLTGSNLERANMNYTRMVGARLVQARLFHSQMKHSVLMHADLRYANLGLANMEDAQLNNANMKEVDLRGAQLSRASMSNVFLDYADCKGALFNKANLEEASLIGVDLQNCDLRGANLYGANLENVNLRGANLSKANLKGVNLRNADIKDANFEQCLLDRYTNLDGVDTSGAINFNRIVFGEERIG